MLRQNGLFALVGLLLSVATVRAEQITYTFAGHVNGIDDSAHLLTGILTPGDKYQVSVTANLNSAPKSYGSYSIVPGVVTTQAVYDATVTTQIGNTTNTQVISNALEIDGGKGGSGIYVRTADRLLNYPIVSGWGYAYVQLSTTTENLLTYSLSHLPLSLPGLSGFMFTTHEYVVSQGPFPWDNNYADIGVGATVDSISVSVQNAPEPSGIVMAAIGLGVFGLYGRFQRRGALVAGR